MTEHFEKRIHKDALSPSLGQSKNLTNFRLLNWKLLNDKKYQVEALLKRIDFNGDTYLASRGLAKETTS